MLEKRKEDQIEIRQMKQPDFTRLEQEALFEVSWKNPSLFNSFSRAQCSLEPIHLLNSTLRKFF
jgi:hypothetical protein